MFFYLYCGRGFNCLYGGQTKKCLVSWSLCDNPENSFGQHKRLWNGRASRRWEWPLFVLWLLWWVIFLLVAVRTHYDFLYFISRQHTNLFRKWNITTLHFQQNFGTANACQTIKSLLNEFALLQASWWYNA